MARIHLVRSPTTIAAAMQALSRARVVGFDTESKPVFVKDVASDGPHVVQFATLEDAFIVQINAGAPVDFLRAVLESAAIVKVGFGLRSDRSPLLRKLGINLHATVDLAQVVRALGFRQAVGIKAAVAIVLARRLPKPKGTTTSNWALPNLRPQQLQYAANDAHAALAVFHALGCPDPSPDGAAPLS